MKRVLLLQMWLLSCIFVGLSASAHGQVTCRMVDEEGVAAQQIVMENSRLRLTLTPAVGGKISSWYDKVAGVELVHWGDGNGGLLDDRGERRKAPYEAVVLEESDSVATVRLSCRLEDDLEVVKTVTVRDDSPVVNIHYSYRNHSQKNLFGFAVGARNFFVPGGGDTVTEADHYSVPTTHAIRRIKGFTMQSLDGSRHPELGTKLKTAVARPWASFIDSEVRQGLGVSLEDNFYVGWYAWKGGAATPTFEWMFGDLPAGYRRDTELNLVQLNGLRGNSYIAPEIASDMRASVDESGKGTLATELLALDESWGETVLKTEVRQIGGTWRRNLPLQKFDSLPRDKIVEVALELALPGEGLYLIEQTLLDGKESRADWVDTITVGKVATEPLFAMQYRAAREIEVIPGWQADAPEAVKGDPASLQRGYALLALSGADEGADVTKWQCHMARNEYESFPLLFHPFQPQGRVALQLEGGAALGARIRLEEVTPHDSRKSGAGIRYSHLLYEEESFLGNEPQRLWLTFGTGELQAGTYSCKLHLTPQAGRGEPKSIELEVVVHDVSLPHRPLVSHEAEGYPMSFPRCGLQLGDERDGAIMDGWFANMVTHGIDFFQEMGSVGHGRVDSHLRLLGETTTLAQDLKANPERYAEDAKLPRLDLSKMDFYFDRALAAGLVRFKLSHYDLKEPTELMKWRYREAYNYLIAKGYDPVDIFVKIMDEQPANRFPDMAKTARWLKEECGYRPFSTFSMLFRRPAELKILAPWFEMYQGGFTTREDWEARVAEGILSADAEVGVYTGNGTMGRSYEEQVIHGWNAAFHNHHFFHNHEYQRGGNNRRMANIILIGDDDLPVDSPSFEGLRDGMESANLIALYREWRALLAATPKAAARFQELDAKLATIMAESEEALVSFALVETPDGPFRRIQPLTFTAATTAHTQLLRLLDEVAPLAKATDGALATATWSGVTFKGHNHGVALAATSDEERAAADDFSTTLQEALGGVKLSAGDIQTVVTFKLLQDDPLFPYSYQIERRSEREVVIKGSTAAGLKQGGRNLIKAMRIKGVWR